MGEGSTSKESIKKQIEFYFSDVNYSKDKFMNTTAENNDGFIPISVLQTFNRLRKLNVNDEDIKAALKDSNVVTVEDGKGIKKIETDEYLYYKQGGTHDDKKVIVSGFPISYELEDVQRLLINPTPIKITLKRNSNKKFIGSCLVEYQSSEDANLVIDKSKEKNESDESDTIKRQKKDEIILTFVHKEEADKVNNWKEKLEKKSEEKIRKDFIQKLYKITNLPEGITINEVKDKIKYSAFVDLPQSIIRMKFIEDWDEKEIEGLKLVKLSEKEATEYVNKLTIKVTKKSKNSKNCKVEILKKDSNKNIKEDLSKDIKKEETEISK